MQASVTAAIGRAAVVSDSASALAGSLGLAPWARIGFGARRRGWGGVRLAVRIGRTQGWSVDANGDAMVLQSIE